MTHLAENKRARYDYDILETFEAGISLFGHEVKSVKTGHVSLRGAFVTIHGNELQLTNTLIPRYPFAGPLPGYDPVRPRTLLIKKSEMKRYIGKVRTNGLTLIPLRVYTKRRLVKVECALAKGKKEFDKRHTIAKREADRTLNRALRTRM
ncbi:MAG: SsrA-binding protein SmpB [Candidatus Moraniibacteriota bacterium]|nr:MAG: SsrA-binding protein SmpB [Candidatus Moranbacteria bacterium]